MLLSLLAIVLLICCFVPAFVWADDTEDLKKETGWDEYSLEELLAIRDEISAVIEEKQREYALEHGNRAISLPEDAIVYVGGTLSLEPSVERLLDDAPERTDLIWTTSDSAVVSVSDKGVLSGLSEGTAIITCKAADNEFVFAEMHVKTVLPVTSVALSEGKVTALMYEGRENGMQLSCTISPESAFSKEVEWRSNNESIATVDENGYVSFLSPGNAVITVQSKDAFSEKRPKSASCSISILQAATEIQLDQANIVMDKGAVLVLRATVLPANTSNKKLIWETSDPNIVSVNNGQIKALSCGTATVTCKAADGGGAEAVCTVEIIQMVKGLKFFDVKSPVTLNRGDSMQLSTELSPADASNKILVWESSDKSVVSVSENGQICAQNGGNVIITCTATDGSGKSASINVYVPSISVSEEEYRVTSMDGIVFNVFFYGKDGDFDVSPASNSLFHVSQQISGNTVTIKIIPLKAGKANLTFKDKSDNRSTRTVSIVIDHSAVYDTFSYPALDHSDVLRYPDKYKGEKCSVSGSVFQVWDSGGLIFAKKFHALVRASGKIYYVTIDASLLDANPLENDIITIFGECMGTYKYTTLLGSSNTVPEITAEKVILGR